MVVNMNIVIRNKISSKLKNSTSAIGYYSYTNRSLQAKNGTKNENLRLIKKILKKMSKNIVFKCFLIKQTNLL